MKGSFILPFLRSNLFKVKLSGTDLIPGYLADKLKQGTNIVIEEVTEGGVKKLQVSATVPAIPQPYQVLITKDITAGTAQSYDLIIKCREGLTLDSIVVETDDGTLTGCTVTIGATAITLTGSVTTFDVSTTLTEIAAISGNVASAGARVKVNTTAGYTGAPTVLNIQLNYTV